MELVTGGRDDGQVISVRKYLVYDSNMIHSSLASWSLIQSIMEEERIKEFTFMYTLRVLEKDEELEFEHTEPLLALVDEIMLTADKDIADVDSPPASKAIEAVDSPPASKVDEATESNVFVSEIRPLKPESTEKEIKKGKIIKKSVRTFLTSDSVRASKPPIPQSYFAANERDQMLKYHDQYDVFTPDGLLR